jgi:hypothetical protein
MESFGKKRWNVYTIRKRPGSDRNFWMKVGVGFVNGDGSINLYLDATPLDGKLQLREWREEAEARMNGAAEEAAAAEAF